MRDLRDQIVTATTTLLDLCQQLDTALIAHDGARNFAGCTLQCVMMALARKDATTQAIVEEIDATLGKKIDGAELVKQAYDKLSEDERKALGLPQRASS